MKPKTTLRRILPIPALILAGTHFAHAASDFWDGGDTNSNWSSGANWVNNITAPGDTAATNNADVATFDAAIANTWGDVGSPILIDSASQNIGGISFDFSAGNYFIGSTGGNPLLLSSGGTIQIAGTLTASDAVETINAPLVIQDAGGTYTLANNSASGVGVGVGTLVVGGDVTGTLAGATVLNLAGSNTNANTLSGIIGNGTATTLGVTKSGTGAWTLSGPNTFTGPITVNGGTLKLTGTQNLPSSSLTSNAAGNTLVIDAGATVTVGATTLGTAGNALTTGAGSTLTMGSGNTTVTLDTTATGTGTIVLTGLATKTLTDLGAAYDGDIVISATTTVGAFPPDANGGQVIVDAGSVNAFGSTVGTTTVNNTGPGVIKINKIPFASATPNAENLVINAGTGYVSLAPVTQFDSIRSGNILINSGTLILNNGGYGTTNSGVVSGNGGIMVINPGDVLTGPNTFSGGVSTGCGRNLTGFYGSTQGITVGGGDTLSGGAILNGPLGTGTLTINVATASNPGAGRLADNGLPSGTTTTLHCNVIQRTTLSFASQSGGRTLVNNSNTMIITDAGLTVPSTWTLEPNPNVWSNQPRNDTEGIPGTSGSQTPLVQQFNVNLSLYTAQIDQVIGQNMGLTPGNMTLRKVGAGTLVLGRRNTYGGDTMAMQGTLKLGISNALPTGTKLAVGGGTYVAADWPELGLVPPNGVSINLGGNTTYGTFDLNGFDQTVSGIGQSSDSAVPKDNIITNSAGTTSNFVANNAASNTFGGTFSGDLNLLKYGAGTLTLNSLDGQAYFGNTAVSAGTLSFSSENAANNSSAVIIASGATLDLNFGGTDEVDQLFIGNTAMPGGFVYEAIGNPGSGVEIPQITGTGTLTVANTGVTGYPVWAALNAGGQSADLDYDNDGTENGVEYFMGQTGSSFTANPGVIGGTVTWPRDPAAVATFIVQVSDDLVNWTDIVPPHASINETNPNQVVYTLPNIDPSEFCRLVVTP